MTFSMSSVRVLSLANIAEYPPGATYGPRVTTSYEFVWLLHGSATWHVAGPGARAPEAHPWTTGVLALSVPGLTERYEWHATGASSHGFVHFDLPRDVDPSGWPRIRRIADQPLLGALATSLLQQSTDDDHQSHERSNRIVGLMLDEFLPEPRGTAPEIAGPSTDVAHRAVRYVRDTWSATGMRLVDIPEISRALGVSGGHLSRAFGTRYGIGPAGGLELIRLARAAVALQHTSSTLAVIAAECGFSDEFHLSKRFSRVYAVPPGAYRRSHGSDEPLAPLLERRLMPLWRSLAYWT